MSQAVVSFIPYSGRRNLIGSSFKSGIGVLAVVKNDGAQTAHSIHFDCSREEEGVDVTMRDIYSAAVGGNADRLLAANPAGCHVGDIHGNCGNVRGKLTECRCSALDRKRNPDLRKRYEDTVIERLLSLARAGQQEINMVMFATGGLSGEGILLMRAFEKLKGVFRGSINIFLIDKDYIGAISKAADFTKTHRTVKGAFAWNAFLGGREDFEAFLGEVALTLPSSIKVSGAFFGLHRDYMERAKGDPNLLHDLLVGSDVDNTTKEIMELQTMSRSKQNAIILARQKGLPVLCEVDHLFHCVPLPPDPQPQANAAAAAMACAPAPAPSPAPAPTAQPPMSLGAALGTAAALPRPFAPPLPSPAPNSGADAKGKK